MDDNLFTKTTKVQILPIPVIDNWGSFIRWKYLKCPRGERFAVFDTPRR